MEDILQREQWRFCVHTENLSPSPKLYRLRQGGEGGAASEGSEERAEVGVFLVYKLKGEAPRRLVVSGHDEWHGTAVWTSQWDGVRMRETERSGKYIQVWKIPGKTWGRRRAHWQISSGGRITQKPRITCDRASLWRMMDKSYIHVKFNRAKGKMKGGRSFQFSPSNM